MTWRCGSSTTMPSSMLLITVSSRSRWLRTSPTRPVTESAMVLNSRASQEMVSVPPAGHAPLQVAGRDLAGGGFEALQAAQHRDTDHQCDGADQQQGDAGGARHQPAQVARHGRAQLFGPVVQDQDAVDLVARIVAAVALGAIADRHDGAQHFAPAGFDDAAGAALVGGILVAGLAGGGVDLQLGVRRSVGRRVALHAGAVEQHQAFHADCLRKLSIIRAIRVRSFSIIWCSSATRIRSPSARAVLAPSPAETSGDAGNRGMRRPHTPAQRRR